MTQTPTGLDFATVFETLHYNRFKLMWILEASPQRPKPAYRRQLFRMPEEVAEKRKRADPSAAEQFAEKLGVRWF